MGVDWQQEEAVSCKRLKLWYTHTFTHSAGCSLSVLLGMWTCLAPHCCAAECGGKMGPSLPEECCTPGEASDCAIVVSLSKKTILGEAHTFSFILQRFWQLLLKESLQGIVGNLRYHLTTRKKWVWFLAMDLVFLPNSMHVWWIK